MGLPRLVPETLHQNSQKGFFSPQADREDLPTKQITCHWWPIKSSRGFHSPVYPAGKAGAQLPKNTNFSILPTCTSLLLISFLQQSFQWTNLAILSCLLLSSFLRQTLALTNNVIYCSTLLATQPTKRGIHWLVNVELDIVCSQCLFFGCKNQCFSFNFQVAFLSPLPGHIFVNCLRHFLQKLTMPFFSVHLFNVAFCLPFLNSFFSLPPSLFKIFVFLTPSINLPF